MAVTTLTPSTADLQTNNAQYVQFAADTNGALITSTVLSTPSDFGTAQTNSNFSVEANLVNPPNNDTYTLRCRIVNGATILAANDAGGTFQTVADITSTTPTTFSNVAWNYVNTTADKATWDGASIELEQGWVKSQAGDGTAIQVDYFLSNISYAANIAIVCDPGTYSYTGADATLQKNSVVVLTPTTYIYSGTVVNFTWQRYITADSGSYSYTGVAANFPIERKIPIDVGAYSYTGNDVGFLKAIRLIAEEGSYSYNGNPVTFEKISRFIWPPDSYTGYYLHATTGQRGYTKQS